MPISAHLLGKAVSSFMRPRSMKCLWPSLGLSANMYGFKWVTEQFRPLTRPEEEVLQI